MEEQERKEHRMVQHPSESVVGSMATPEALLHAGGKFYSVGGGAYCDLPTSTWKLESPTDPGYTRIE